MATFPDFEIAERRLIDTTEEGLGDRIKVAVLPAGFVDVKGFVLTDHPVMDAAGMADVLNHVTRIKLRKWLLPAGDPDRMKIRFRAEKLGAATYQPAGEVEDGTSHWLFDIQKVDD